MPSGPKKRKAARRKNEAAKGQESPQQDGKDIEKDGSFCGSFDEQDDYSSSPSPRLLDKTFRSTSSLEERDSIRSNTEEWVRVSNLDSGPFRHANEAEVAGFEDPTISKPLHTVADWETISNRSCADHQKVNCFKSNESEGILNVSAGITGHVIPDSPVSPCDESPRELIADSDVSKVLDTQTSEKAFVGQDHSGLYPHEAEESIVYDHFDSISNSVIMPSSGIDETIFDYESGTKHEEGYAGSLSSEEMSGMPLFDKNEEMTTTTVCNESSNAEGNSVLLGTCIPVPDGKEMAPISSNGESMEQDTSAHEMGEGTGCQVVIPVCTDNETHLLEECIMDVEESVRKDNKSSAIGPNSSDTVEMESSFVSAHEDAPKKLSEESIAEVLPSFGMDAQDSLTGLRNPDVWDMEREDWPKAELSSGMITNKCVCSEDGKDSQSDMTSSLDLDANLNSLPALDSPGKAKDNQESHSQLAEYHLNADPEHPISGKPKKRDCLGYDTSNAAQSLQNAQENQVDGPNKHEKLTTWKDCCGVFEWLFSRSG